MNYTANEKTVFNAMIDLSVDEPYIVLNDIYQATEGYRLKELKGIVGSLVKKGLVAASTDQDHNGRDIDVLYPLGNGNILAFACDHYSDEEMEAFKI